MRGFDRKRLLLMIFLTSLAIAILGKGLSIFVEGDIKYDSDIKKLENGTLVGVGWDFNGVYPFHDTPDGKMKANLKFGSIDVFAVNNTVYSVTTATIDPPDSLRHLYFIIPEEEEDISKLAPADIPSRINDAIRNHTLINMTKLNSITFFNQMVFNFQIPQKIAVNTIFENNKSEYLVLPKSYTLFVVESHLSKIQADTDRDIQRQNVESEKTNGHVEGLTLVIVGLVPLGLFMETIIHRFLTDYGKNNST